MKKFIIMVLICIFSIQINTFTVRATETTNISIDSPKCSMKPLYVKKSVIGNNKKLTKKELEQAKQLYKKIKTCKKGKNIIIHSMSDKKMSRLLDTVDNKYFPYSELLYGTGFNDKYGDFYYITYKNAKKAIKDNAMIEKEIKKIIKKLNITKNTSQVEAIIKINDYLVSLIDYNLDNKNNRYKTTLAALKTKEGICQDYATCFQYLAQYCGIKAGYVLDYKIEHAYNVVKINDKAYYIDVCWNDGSNSNMYLLLSEEEMSKDHYVSDSDIYYNCLQL